MTLRQRLLRRMLPAALLAGALAATAILASAQNITVRGAGTCQGYLEAKRTNSVQEAVKDLTWFMGYVSGLAVASHVDVLGKGDNADTMLDWVDAYCGRYPANYLSDAANLYYRFRLDQMKAANPK